MIKTTKQTPASGAKVAMTKDTLEEIAMTRDLKKTDDMKKEEEGMTGKAAEKKDETEAGKKKTGEDKKKEETETKDEVVPGGLEEKDLDPKEQIQRIERRFLWSERTIKRTKKSIKERGLHLPEVPDKGP